MQDEEGLTSRVRHTRYQAQHSQGRFGKINWTSQLKNIFQLLEAVLYGDQAFLHLDQGNMGAHLIVMVIGRE